MNEKILIPTFFSVITFLLVFLMGSIYSVGFLLIFKRLIIFVPIMGALGFIINFLFLKWKEDLSSEDVFDEDLEKENSLGSKIDLKDEDNEEYQQSNNYDVSGGYKIPLKNNNEMNLDPKRAAMAIKQLLADDNEKST